MAWGFRVLVLNVEFGSIALGSQEAADPEKGTMISELPRQVNL